MQQNIKKRGFFSVVSPFFVYYGISFIVQIIASAAITISCLPKIMEMADVGTEQQLYVTEEITNLVVDKYMQHLTLMTAVAALCVIPIFWMMFRKDNLYEEQIGFPKRIPVKGMRYVYIPFLAAVLSIGFNNLLLLSNLSVYSENYQTVSTALYEESFLLQIIGLGIIVPIAEEFMFRGLIYRRLSYLAGTRYAIILSAVIFGVYHGNLVQGLYGLVMGLLLAWAYEKYGSMKAPIFFHIAANLTSVIATKLNLFNWIFQDYARVMVTTVVAAALGAAIYVKMRNTTPVA